METLCNALAHPIRKAIVEELSERPGRTLAELSAGFPVSRPALTGHLDILESAGIVLVLRGRKLRRHRVNPTALRELSTLLQSVAANASRYDSARHASGVRR